MKTIKTLASKIIDKLSGKVLARIAYFILVVIVVFIGFDQPDTVVKILKAITEALSFLL